MNVWLSNAAACSDRRTARFANNRSLAQRPEHCLHRINANYELYTNTERAASLATRPSSCISWFLTSLQHLPRRICEMKTRRGPRSLVSRARFSVFFVFSVFLFTPAPSIITSKSQTQNWSVHVYAHVSLALSEPLYFSVERTLLVRSFAEDVWRLQTDRCRSQSPSRWNPFASPSRGQIEDAIPV